MFAALHPIHLFLLEWWRWHGNIAPDIFSILTIHRPHLTTHAEPAEHSLTYSSPSSAMPPKKAERGAPGGSGGAGEEAKEDLVAKEAPVAVVSKAALAALGEEVAAPAGAALAAAVAVAARSGQT